MAKYLSRAKNAIICFQEACSAFYRKADRAVDSRELPQRRLDEIKDLLNEAREAGTKILDSLNLINKTALDVADMETRLMGQSKDLAKVLNELGKKVAGQHFVRVEFQPNLVEVDEELHNVAGTIFPSAVQGLNFVNSELWQFSRLQMSKYERKLKELEEAGRISISDKNEIDGTFTNLSIHFDKTNKFLDKLARGTISGKKTPEMMDGIYGEIRRARELANKAAKLTTHKEFKAILQDTHSTAKNVDRKLKTLRIPLFPKHNQLEELAGLIQPELYRSLPGLQKFALLNIASRMRSISINGSHLLDDGFHLRIWNVFTDRIYFDADKGFLNAIENHDDFKTADASLHRFSDGSYKQTYYPEGNLQTSYKNISARRISVDADIDLYKDQLLHFFGEVLVNHLSGQKTDPFRVYRILEQQDVAFMGGFKIHPV